MSQFGPRSFCHFRVSLLSSINRVSVPASEKSKAIIPYYVDIHTDILRTYIGGMQGIRRHIHISTENINHFEESRQLTIFLFIIGDQQCNVASSFSVTSERIKNNFLDALPSLDFKLSLSG